MKKYAVIDINSNKILNVIIVDNFIPEYENCKLVDCTGKNSAQINGTYDEENQRFIDIQPYPSWILNNETGLWEAPTPRPPMSEGQIFVWDEENNTWKEIV
jgi:hypothetical protein